MLDWSHIRIEVESVGSNDGGGLTEDAVRSGVWRGWFRHHTLWWLRGGRARLVTHHGTEDFSAGLIVWFRPGFAYRFDGPITEPLLLDTAHFHLIEQPSGRRLHAVPGVADVFAPADPDYVAAVMSRIAALGERIPDQHHRVFRSHHRERAERLLTELLIELSEQSSAPDEPESAADPMDLQMLDIGRRIATNAGRWYSVEALAREAKLSVAQFDIRFERVNREKPKHFIIRHRIALASQLLTETTLPVGEISDRCGYDTVYYFSRQFKKWTGKSPRAFRQGRSSVRE